jgi:hypothetical protein
MSSDGSSSHVEHWQRRYAALSQRIRSVTERLGDKTLPAAGKQHAQAQFVDAWHQLAAHMRRHPLAPQRSVYLR